jgi:hypothetical protein
MAHQSASSAWCEPTKEGEVPRTQIVLAEACGLSAVHAKRSIGSLRKSDLLHIDRATVTLPSWQKLTGAANFNYAYLQRRSRFAALAEGESLFRCSNLNGGAG